MKTWNFLFRGNLHAGLLAIVLLSSFWSFSSLGTLSGTITDGVEPLIGANISISQNKMLLHGVVTDYNGQYRIQLPEGYYDVSIAYTGFEPFTKKKVKIKAGEITPLDVKMAPAAPILEEVVVVSQEQDRANSVQTLRREQVKHRPSKTAPSTPGTVAGGKDARVNGAGRYNDGSHVSSGAAPAEINNPSPASKVDAPKEKKVSQPAPQQNVQTVVQGPLLRDDPQISIPSGTSATNPVKRDPVEHEQYNGIVENAFQQANTNAVSTFSIDVDGASYANIRRFLQSGEMPPPDAVRMEEMINYFDYQYDPPKNTSHPFAVHTEMGPCPWNTQNRLLSIGIQGSVVDREQLPPSNLVFLIDVSGSMSSPNKLPLVKESLNALTAELRANDRVAMVVYAGASGLALASTPGTEKYKISSALNNLESGGSTAGSAGIMLAYETARKNFIRGGNNRVILCTDGDFNVGPSSEQELITLIEKERESGVYLTVLGFGMGNYQDGKMQSLANKGNGNHAYIDHIKEAKKVLLDEFSGTLFTIAKDVKLQVHFNPKHVAGYRLIGYENRVLATQDFNDDTKDAGELGAGHRVTALYEIVPAGQVVPKDTVGMDLQTVVAPDTAVEVAASEMMVLQMRYKKPRGHEASKLLEFRLPATAMQEQSASDNFLLASSVAEFGLLLRHSHYKGSAHYEQALKRARQAAAIDPKGYRTELVKLMEAAQKLSSPTAASTK